MKGKKGSVHIVLERLPDFLFTIIALAFVVALFWYFSTARVDINEIKQEVVIERILYSNNGIMEFDEKINRNYPGVVDLSNLTEERLSTFIDVSKSNLAGVLIIQDIHGNEIKRAYIDKRMYDIWSPYAEAYAGEGIAGKGSASMLIRKFPVSFDLNEQKQRGYLLIKIVTPNN